MIGDLKYTITEGSNVSVGLVEDRYDINGTLTIPSKIANKGVGYTVTSIAGSVRVIGDHAFSDSQLRNIGFPDSLESIRDSAFKETSPRNYRRYRPDDRMRNRTPGYTHIGEIVLDLPPSIHSNTTGRIHRTWNPQRP